MTIQQFIEAAIEGEYFQSGVFGPKRKYVVWKDPVAYGIYWIRWDTFPTQPMEGRRVDVHWALLDPKIWEAVGKVKGWGIEDNYFGMTKFAPIRETYKFNISFSGAEWQWHMFCMTDALLKGKTLEGYIATL